MSLADIQAMKALKIAKQNSIKKGFIYNADTGLRKWRVALADVQSSNKIINVQIINDSIGEGYGSGSQSQGWSYLLKQYFANKFQDVGFGTMPEYMFNYFPNPQFTYSGSWTDGSSFGFCNRIKQTNTGGDTVTTSFTGNGVDILYTPSLSGGQISISIDGGTATTVSTNGPTSPSINKYSITGLSSGSHTLTITKVADGEYFFFIGICPTTTATKGIRFNLVGVNGGSADAPSSSTNALYSGIDYWSPPLTIIEMFANDVVHFNPSQYQTNMQTLISRALQFGDVLLFPTGIRDDSTLTTPQSNFINVLNNLVATNNVCLVDAFNYWGGNYNTANATLGVMNDVVHPNTRGHQDLCNLIIKALS